MAQATQSRWFHVTDKSRAWEDFYRDRWSYDKTVRTSHGVNCSGSCSWEVFVKDGVITWELQKTDWPQINSDTPNHEPRGCQRGISTSWYVYSPVRPKYPYIRGKLLEFYREERASGKDPVAAFAAIVNDPKRSAEYKEARGKAGWRRVSWDEATELAAAGLIHTIKKWGPDRIAGFSPIPAMSMVSWCAGARLTSLLGASVNSFYEWYHDNPHCQPKNFGEQTDVHESADWYQSTYWLNMGTNLPMTRTPDAHFMPEFKYKGGKLVVFSPNYSDITKFADTWVQLKAGTDAAILAAMNHVVIKEFFIDRQVPYFQEYTKKYTSLPFLLRLEKKGDHYVPGRLLRASDVPEFADEENGDWKTLQCDSSGNLRLPHGTLGFRWEEEHTGKWNLHQKDAATDQEFDPALSVMGMDDERPMVAFPDFTGTFSVDVGKSDPDAKPGMTLREIPAKKVTGKDGETYLVTTGFDLLAGHMGVPRGLGGDYPKDYDDTNFYTPAWQEQETGISREVTIRIAREWAENAEKTRGKSLIIAGPGCTHWYHSDLYQRFGVLLGALTGCHGVNGGGWCHYVGTEKIRNVAAVVGTIGMAKDWQSINRVMNSTSYWYFHTDQWRYDGMKLDQILVPWAEEMPKYNHSADMNAVAVRNGWLPFYPTLNKNPLEIIKDAEAAGHSTDDEIRDYVVEQIRTGELKFGIDDPDDPANFPRALMVWRGNLIGTSMRGHMLALRHLLGTHHNVSADPDVAKDMIKEIEWRDGETVPEGKLDLLINVELRMISTSNYSDVLLPAAHWYEKTDLTVTDLHTFIHPFSAAHDPAWETKSDWDAFKLIAEKFSQMAPDHFPEKVRDLVITPLATDSPDEYAQPWGSIKDWKYGDCEMIPGKTMPKIDVVTREYARTHEKYTSFGTNVNKNYGVKGITFDISDIHADLIEDHRVGPHAVNGLPTLEKDIHVAETILQISPETNGEAAHRSWGALEKRTGLDLTPIVEGERDHAFRYDDLISQPRRVLTSAHWSGLEPPGRTYSPWTANVEHLIPWRTLTGRIDLYHDHQVYQDLGESYPVYKPPIDTTITGVLDLDQVEPDSKIFRFLTPHGKWSIHSNFWDNLWMLRMFRGGQVIWMNPKDAEEIGVKDNDWLEAYSETGIVVARAAVSQQVSRDTVVMYHMSERNVNVPFSQLAQDRGLKDLRGGNTNAPTRIQMNPSFMTGGYAQFSYGINYWGTSPAERDMAIAVRKLPLGPDGKPIYREELLPNQGKTS
jgi:nitrate reductase alpha subunit